MAVSIAHAVEILYPKGGTDMNAKKCDKCGRYYDYFTGKTDGKDLCCYCLRDYLLSKKSERKEKQTCKE